MVENMTSYRKVALKRYYLDHIMMQFAQGSDYPADTSPVDSGCICSLQRLPWGRPIRSAITSQHRAVISRLSVRCRISGRERCWVWVCQRATGCPYGEVRCKTVFFSHIYKSEQEDGQNSVGRMQGRCNLLRASARSTFQRWMVFIWVFPCLWVSSHYHIIKHSPPGNYTDTCIASSLQLLHPNTHTCKHPGPLRHRHTLFCCISQHFIRSISSLGFVIVYPPSVTSTTVGYYYLFQRGAFHFTLWHA